MFHLLYTDRALKSLKKIPQKDQGKILKAIAGLKRNPYEGKKLQGSLLGLMSLRVWPYRVIYGLHKKTITITIFNIGHRQGVYTPSLK